MQKVCVGSVCVCVRVCVFVCVCVWGVVWEGEWVTGGGVSD